MIKKDTYNLRNLGGRPVLFETDDDIIDIFEKYLDYIKENDVPMTLERFSVFCGCDTSTLCDYATKPQFSKTIKRIKEIIKSNKLERLNAGKGSTAGIIFDLKNNHGMVDRQEIKQDITGDIRLSDLFNIREKK